MQESAARLKVVWVPSKSSDMAVYKLEAVSAFAKSRPNPDILLEGEETLIGRSAVGPGALPIDWAQCSGKHCKVVLASKVRRTPLHTSTAYRKHIC